ncbi:MAG TPA: hypothetical protein VK824_12470 [Planctomycetota bacterium]|nr:hypothetical protein [Planctomycetota bacterium]
MTTFRRRLPVLTLALALAVAAPLSSPASAALIPGNAAQAVKDFKTEIDGRLATLKASLAVLDAQFAADLLALKNDVKNGVTTPSEAHLSAFAQVDALDGDVEAALAAFAAGVQTDASAELATIVAFPNAFVVGDGGLVDIAVHKAADLRVKSTVKNFSKLKALVALLDKSSHYDIVVDRRGQAVPPVVPTDSGTPADAAFVPLRVDLLVAGSDRSVNADGRVCLAGTADTANGATVDVAITRAGDAPVTATVTVDAQTGRWSVSFPATGAGDLPEGNYAVTITQGGVSLSDSIGVQ